ncbi:phospho-sugar mutase [Synoicihabitans lomoniglobus]|uniref:Phospho-sugar mutase n=1 Tax=Synoicihabitans lomoniglobus TaxID=2909285 RepID=A0AAF0CT23_9BACT|nr:phospho-sugar mutase [Opitutaceae bacterium LMO-M01]WED67466.1 phospho-sugar mutase [Opitutaceae bacterium LMO-M01]
MSHLDQIKAAGDAGKLLPSAVENISTWLDADLPAWVGESIGELVQQEAWDELNDRFYRYLAFGTGGMRGRTIGRVVTSVEAGTLGPQGTPTHAAAGCNVLNDFTLVRAVVGLFRYVSAHLAAQDRSEVPTIVIAHDVRHFSRHFCELAASTWIQLGGNAFIFDGPRSTPQLSFSVRWLGAHTGVVITASHNPPHDNGFKAYFEDGAQVVPPHDKGIVDQVNAVPLNALSTYLDVSADRVVTLGRPADDAYLAAAAKAAIDPDIFKKTDLGLGFTNIHGVGGVSSVPLLAHAGCRVCEVPEQSGFDPRFPTVKSPNPENAEALKLAIELAEKKDLDVIVATDPDCDRMGCAVRGADGAMHLLTGNQIGALLADYRIGKYKELGWIPAEGSEHVAMIKTFVTSPLQDAIGRGHGVKVINTLTGFKWIAAKMRVYEEQLTAAMLAEGVGLDYDATPFEARAKLLQKHSTFYAFGTEESYGYLPNDYVRDKDGNAACLMFAEFCAAVKASGETVLDRLDALYRQHGYFLEGTINLYYEGATGADKIARILSTYRDNPPTEFGGVAVSKFEDFGVMDIRDADDELIPKQDLYLVSMANGYSFAARGSGTEPKMKFYVFANAPVGEGTDLEVVKTEVAAELDRIKSAIESDAKLRADG